jgi:hypothetical protein
MSDLIEAREAGAQALQDHMEQFHGVCLSASQWDAAMSAALAALRETHHLVPKDQEPVAYAEIGENGLLCALSPVPHSSCPIRLYALEKRHD